MKLESLVFHVTNKQKRHSLDMLTVDFSPNSLTVTHLWEICSNFFTMYFNK